MSPRPKERLRMISTRRAREADLDNSGLRSGGAIYSWTGAISRAEPTPSTGQAPRASPFPGISADATDADLSPTPFRDPHDHRTSYLERTERPQDQRGARGDGAALQGRSGQHRQGRADGAVVSG